MNGARLSAPGAVAMSAGGLTVEGGVFCVDGFTAAGEVRMVGAKLGANLALAGAKLHNPGKVALDLDRAVMGNCNATRLVCTGRFTCVANAAPRHTLTP